MSKLIENHSTFIKLKKYGNCDDFYKIIISLKLDCESWVMVSFIKNMIKEYRQVQVKLNESGSATEGSPHLRGNTKL
jgi:uncharacterized protein YeeX (DUF496 family)